jgi:hypothetical protein
MRKTNVISEVNAPAITIVDAPDVSLAEGEEAGELLLHFYRALGWNGKDFLNPCKVRTTQEVYNCLQDKMHERYPNIITVGMFMVNSGPSVDNFIPLGKVHLLEGWLTPAPEEGETANAA